MKRVFALVSGLFLCAAAAHAQVPPRDAQAPARDPRPAAAGTASIAGTIISDTEPARPLRRAVVTLNAPDMTTGRTTVTDDSGRFLFDALPSGRYSVAASKPGWTSMSHGARRPGRPGTSIQLDDGKRSTVSIRLPRGAAITGAVLDPDGQPVSGVVVRAMHYAYTFNSGDRRLTQAGTTVGPDEHGAYRIYGLPPGDYVVSASTRTAFFSVGRSLHVTTDVDVQQALAEVQQGPSGPQATPTGAAPEHTVGYATVYYPGTPVATQASMLTLRAGEERNGVDVALALIPTARVEGVVSFPDGTPPPGTRVSLITNDQAAVTNIGLDGFREGSVGPNGAFLFADVSPGSYTVAARVAVPQPSGAPRAASTQILWSTAEIDVQGDPVTGVALPLQPGFSLSGTLRFDGVAAPPTNLSGARVNLQPVAGGNQVTISSAGTTVDSDGRFTIGGLTPGRYRLTAFLTGARAWTLRSSVINGQDTLDAPLDIRQSLDGAVVTFTDHPAEIRGTLQTAAGAAALDYFVILFSGDRAHWIPQSRRIQSIRPASDGSYAFKNLPPGDYLIAAVDDVEPGEWFDPSFLEHLVPAALKVTVGDGEQRVQDIRVGGG